ncbi:mitochondrial outer membrane protein SLC25A46-like [Diabrotica virgifera virgifera]|uniref:Solute carrier family 25 member 46-like n=1 Tax=Diabrotica virgifera virgifera TaxID=50390 RepID=A0A6P7GRG8_DIAVI|nr:mitochondrial outer membrane protein SLC25A46-like [Diabrotica virgifera virgifera]
MDRSNSFAYQYQNTDEPYFNNPDLIRRLPVHDDFLKQEPFLDLNYAYPEDIKVKKYIGSGVTFISLVAENLLSHPFVVLRRQCQVHQNAQKYHLQPFTLMPVVWRLYQHQGITSLWKGIGSVLLVKGMSLGVDDMISKVTPWPKDISWHSSLKQFCQHTLLKCLSLATVTPFYSASFVETVQSEIASEKPGILDVFKEGIMRLLHWGSPANGRMLPIWALIVPTITLGLAKYMFSMLVKGITIRILAVKSRARYEENGALPKDPYNTEMQDIQLTASLVGLITTDILFYPFETVIHRIHLQGTRTIIDNLDTGRSVLPILTNYSGAIDCYESCLANEGVGGLYKGFGALILQYTIHVALIKMSHWILTQVGNLVVQSPKSQPKVPAKISPPAISNLTVSRRSYLLP